MLLKTFSVSSWVAQPRRAQLQYSSRLAAVAAILCCNLLALTLPGAETPAPGGDNPCTNGSFEVLGQNGFPLDWGPVGREVSLSADAHSGKQSLRLLRTTETATVESGLNRTKLIPELKGGIDFWYKAISASGAKLNIYVIPINEQGVERTGSPRATFTIPEDHIGDGQWHHARLKYDYSDNPKVSAVHFAARIVGAAGELLLDDFQYIATVGPIPQIKKLMFEEDPQAPGQRGTVRVLVSNSGDQPAKDVQITLQLPQEPKYHPQSARLSLRPDETRALYFPLVAERNQPVPLVATAVCGELSDTRRLELKAGLRVRSFGPAEPVVAVGQTVVLECEIENTGNTNLSGISVVFETPQGATRQIVPRLFPTRRTIVRRSFLANEETPRLPVTVKVEAEGVALAEGTDGRWSAESSVAVVKALQLPPPQGRFGVSARPVPILENDSFRLVVYPCQQRYFATRLEVKTPQGWKVAGWLVSMGRLVLRDPQGQPEEYLLAADSCLVLPPPAAVRGVLGFPITIRTKSGAVLSGEVVLSVGLQRDFVLKSHLKADQPVELLAWGLPMLYIHQRDEAIFPGLEWLSDDELSSDSLDIAEDHPDRIRYVVHPDMVTIPVIGIHGPHGAIGVGWGYPNSFGESLRPACAFASPDRFNHQRSHLVELFLPPVPEFTPVNCRVAEKPYLLKPGEPITLGAFLWVDGAAQDAVGVIADYVRAFRKLTPDHELPHSSLLGEIEFSARAYLESLWDPETQKWWTTKGNALLSQQALPADYAADLALAALLTGNQELRQRCQQRLEEVCPRLGLPSRLDALRIGGRADRVWANAARIAGLLASRRDDGSWRFDADRPGSGPFVGMDYRELGPNDALEVGTCARNAYEVLAFARITGDHALYSEMVKTLDLMEQFRVPRAAQVWEVPVHTPDVLAAADAVDAYIEAYRLSGAERWLKDAVLWAKRGIPFIYLGSDPEKPYLQGASIPVFGATWYRGSWFGRPVQWNGLRYANAILKLADYDTSLPWRELATLIIHSAIHQQDQAGENVALWPDNISAITGEKCPWVFAPRQIIGCIGKLIGRDEEPQTVYASLDGKNLALTSLGKIEQIRLNNGVLEFQIRFPDGEVGPVLIANIAGPEQVQVDGQPIPQNDQPHLGSGSAWCYDAGYALLTIQIGVTGPVKVSVRPAVHRMVERIPRLVKAISFDFDAGLEGWIAARDVAELEAKDGLLAGRITGPDPYIIRPNTRIPAAANKTVIIRISTTAGRIAQFFWATEADPVFTEEKSLRFEVQPDGQMHEYRLDLAAHPKWRDQVIVALRLDPGGSTPNGVFAVEVIKGEVAKSDQSAR
ncbi:MAG: hypothetical protein ACUVTH_03445 [Thermogutta sp.]